MSCRLSTRLGSKRKGILCAAIGWFVVAGVPGLPSLVGEEPSAEAGAELREVIVSHSDENGILQLFRKKEDGSESVQLTHSKTGCRMPAVSPDGSKLVYVEPGNHGLALRLSDLDGGNARILLGEGRNLLPSWMPDGRHILWMKGEAAEPRQDPAGNSRIHLMNTETGESRRLFTDPEQIKFSNAMPSISPDGKQVAFVSNRSGAFRIWVSDFDGSNARMISPPPRDKNEDLQLPVEQKVPVWSPDGRWIAHWEGVEMIHMSPFTGVKNPERDREIAATFHVVAASVDGTQRREVGRGDDPTWSPDGFVTRAFPDPERGGPTVVVETEAGEKELPIVPPRRKWGRFCWVPETRPIHAPNIIVILADDLGYEDLGLQASPEAQTPHIDSIAKNGIQCTNAYITAPVCSPSRAGLLTGRYQNRFGFEFLVNETSIIREGHTNGLSPDETTLATLMKEQGYVTGCIGKWHLGTAEECLPRNRGFDEFYGSLGQGNYFTPNIVDTRVDSIPRKITGPDYYLTDDYAKRAGEFIDTHQDNPFFLYLPHFAVHKPHEATPEYLKRFRHIDDPIRRSYLAILAAMDDAVGRVLAALRRCGIEDNTLIFFFSDNGGTRGSSNAPLRGKKGGTWEGGVRTPFLVQWKSQFEGGRRFDGIVSALDVFPTALAAGGAEIESDLQLDGLNLLPFFKGEKEMNPDRTLYWRFGTQWAIRKGPWKLLRAREARGGNIQIARVGPVRLFHLEEDIAEQSDLAPAMPQKVERLKQQWEEWNKTLPEPSWHPRPVE